MGVPISQYGDLFNASIVDYGKRIVEDLSLPLQNYTAYEILTKGGGLEKYTASGPSIRRDVRLNGQGNASWADLYEAESLNNRNMMAQMSAPYRFLKTGYAFDAREQQINIGDNSEVIYDLIKNKRQAAFCDQAELFENSFWDCPDNDSDNQMLGLFYWLAYNATPGFTGGVPAAAFTTVGGLNPTTVGEKWKNWSGQYTNPTATDLVRKIRQAYVKTGFKNPITQVASVTSPTRRFGMFTTYAILSKLEELQESRADDISSDLAKKDGATMFRGIPVEWSAQLDATFGEADQSTVLTANTVHPFVGVDWSSFKLLYSPDLWFRESHRVNAANHNVTEFWVDSKCQLMCFNRRRNFLLARNALFA